MSTRNPKQKGSNLYDCRVQTGPCPNDCNQCFYNRPGAYYEDINLPHSPPDYVGGSEDLAIVRMNCGHDSNFEREKVIAESKKYKNVFFNTSIPAFDFPGPVVFTANPKEEQAVYPHCADNLMFVRFRTSSTNLGILKQLLLCYMEWRPEIKWRIPIVLTFMAYYAGDPPDKENYIWKKRHINSYWCPTPDFMRRVVADMKKIGGRLVTMCGTPDSPWCRDCRNCETYYWQTIKHMKETAL